MSWDILSLKNFGTCIRTSVPESKINAVAQSQLAWQMLTLPKDIQINNEKLLKSLVFKRLFLIKYNSLIYVDVITYHCPNFKTDLADLCKKEWPW